MVLRATQTMLSNQLDRHLHTGRKAKAEGGFSDELREEKNRQAMCAACTTSKGFETLQDVVKDRMDSMMFQDWLTLFLASLVVACA